MARKAPRRPTRTGSPSGSAARCERGARTSPGLPGPGGSLGWSVILPTPPSASCSPGESRRTAPGAVVADGIVANDVETCLNAGSDVRNRVILGPGDSRTGSRRPTGYFARAGSSVLLARDICPAPWPVCARRKAGAPPRHSWPRPTRRQRGRPSAGGPTRTVGAGYAGLSSSGAVAMRARVAMSGTVRLGVAVAGRVAPLPARSCRRSTQTVVIPSRLAGT